MSAPKGLPLPLAFALALLATWFPTPRARALASLWRVDAAALPFIGAWLSPEFFIALTLDAPQLDALAQLLTSQGYSAPVAPFVVPKTLAWVMAALSRGESVDSIDAPALAAFAESLPAVVTHARLPDHMGVRALDATALRSLASVAGNERLDVHRVAVRAGGAMASAHLFVTPSWRALIRSREPEGLDPPAVQMRSEAAPVALVCAECSKHAASVSTCDEQSGTARRRRWLELDTDEGVVFVCRQCVAARPCTYGAPSAAAVDEEAAS